MDADGYVLLKKEEAEDLRRRAEAKANLSLHIISQELKLKKEKEINARLMEKLLNLQISQGEINNVFQQSKSDSIEITRSALMDNSSGSNLVRNM